MAKETVIISDEDTQFRVAKVIGGLNLDKPWVVSWERHVKRRTLSQNALMWKWVDEVVDHVEKYTGHDKDEIHDYFKDRFLPTRIISFGDDVRRVTGSTKKLNTTEMTDYMNKIYAWATTELGLFLPVPEDLGRDKAA